MKQQYKDHHIVPKTYLNQFTKHNGKLLKIRLNRDTFPKQLKEFHPSQICYKPNFFKIDNDFILKQFNLSDALYIEKNAFKSYENGLEKIISSIRKQQNYLDICDATLLVKGLLSIKQRNESVRRTYDTSNINSVFDNYIQEMEIQREEWETILSRIEDYNFEKLAYLIEKMRNNWLTNPLLLKDLHNQSILNTYFNKQTLLSELPNFLIKLPWIIYETTVKDFYITSDNPGFCIDENEIMHNTKFAGTFAFLFPLTPLHLLFISNIFIKDHPQTNIKKLHFINAEPNFAKLVNRATTVNSNREIYSNSEITLRKVWEDYIKHKKK